jgi:hypothetical protein
VGAKSGDPIEAIGRFTRGLRYYAIEIGWSGLIPRSPETTLERAFGDCKDKAQLMVALLKRAGIAAVPVLAVAPSDRHVDELLPSPLQFNHAIVGIPWSGRDRKPGMLVVDTPDLGPIRLFDPTLSGSHPQDISALLEGGAGLPLDPRTVALLRFPESPPDENVHVVFYRLALAESGSLHVGLETSLSGAMRRLLEDGEGEVVSRDEVRRRVFRDHVDDCPGLEHLEVPSVRATREETWGYSAQYDCPDAVVEASALEIVDLPGWIDRGLFLAPGASEGTVTRLPVLGTLRHEFELDPGARVPVMVPSGFEVENSLGRVSVVAGTGEGRVRVRREVVVSSREIRQEDRSEADALERALRRARALSVVLRRAD